MRQIIIGVMRPRTAAMEPNVEAVLQCKQRNEHALSSLVRVRELPEHEIVAVREQPRVHQRRLQAAHLVRHGRVVEHERLAEPVLRPVVQAHTGAAIRDRGRTRQERRYLRRKSSLSEARNMRTRPLYSSGSAASMLRAQAKATSLRPSGMGLPSIMRICTPMLKAPKFCRLKVST